MASATVRITEKSHRLLRELATESGVAMQAMLDQAIEDYRRRRFLEAGNAEYEALRQNPDAWAEYQKELALWEATLMDGLDPDERWTADADVVSQSQERAAGDESGSRRDPASS